jgi:hypothetical protein
MSPFRAVHGGPVCAPRVTGFTFLRAHRRDPALCEGVLPSRHRREPAMIATTVLRPPAPRSARGLRASLAATWRTLAHDLFDPNRPERHYMRGPGPKWRAKHAASAAAH